MSLPINEIVCGECVEVLKGFPDESVDLTMFSPPYWGLRDYGVDGQIGLEEHPLRYVEKMVLVCGEVKRVLKKSGSMYVVIGDTYYGSGQHNPIESHGKMVVSSFISAVSAKDHIPNKRQSNWLQPKQLLGIPWRVAIALQETGWILRNDIIWAKPNHMPSSVTDRLTNAYEHIFHFVKSRRYYYDLDAIREPHKVESLKRDKQGYKTSPMQGRYQVPWEKREGTLDQEFCNPLGKNPSDILKTEDYFRPETDKPLSQHQKWEREGNACGSNKNGKNPSDFWNVTTKPFKGAHFAVYPEQLCIRPIKSSCPLDGTVLDPFAGSGTTLAVAKKLGRKYVGIDLNPKYVELARKRLSTIPEKLDTFLSEGSFAKESSLEVSER